MHASRCLSLSEGSDCTPSQMSYSLACRDTSLSSLCSSQLHILTVREAFPRTSHDKTLQEARRSRLETSTDLWCHPLSWNKETRHQVARPALSLPGSSRELTQPQGSQHPHSIPVSQPSLHSSIQISIDHSLHCCLSSNGPNTSNSSRVQPLLSKKRRLNT